MSIEIKKTKKGWVIETTDQVNGMLEQGGYRRRRVLYTCKTIARAGVNYVENPDGDCGYSGFTNIEYLMRFSPDKVLSKGILIR